MSNSSVEDWGLIGVCVELMFMGDWDEKGRFEKVWKLVMPFLEDK